MTNENSIDRLRNFYTEDQTQPEPSPVPDKTQITDAESDVKLKTTDKAEPKEDGTVSQTEQKASVISKVKRAFPTNWTLLAIFAAIIGYKILETCSGKFDSDMWWLLATGREILENGIPYTNPWAMHDDLYIVVQQWLYTVILYSTYASFGFLGVKFLVLIECLILTFVLFWVCRMLTDKRSGSGEMMGFVIAIGIFSLSSYLSERPHVYSMILYFLVLGILETYRRNNNYLILFTLPLITCFHVNIHSAMAPFDLVIIAVYLIPNIPAIFKRFNKNVPFQFELSNYKRIPLLIALFVSAFALLINPYSVTGALYVVLSYEVADFKNYISEMGATGFWNDYGIATIILIVLGSIAIGKKGIKNIDVPLTCMFLGCIPISTMHTRNVWLAGLFAMPLLVRALKDYSLNCEKINKFVSKKNAHIAVIVVLALVGCGWYSTQKWPEVASNAESDSSTIPSSAMDYLDEYTTNNGIDKTSLRIYNPFNCGGYMEWRGYKVFMDQRPELWDPSITQVAATYYTSYVIAQESLDGISNLINTYDFDFCIAFSNSLAEIHLDSSSLFKKVLTGKGYSLYARSDNSNATSNGYQSSETVSRNVRSSSFWLPTSNANDDGNNNEMGNNTSNTETE